MILLDLKKAFVTLDRDVLLDKMKDLGSTSKTINWFGTSLKKRNIVVRLEKPLLETGILNCGALQGLILGSILFLYYTRTEELRLSALRK